MSLIFTCRRVPCCSAPGTGRRGERGPPGSSRVGPGGLVALRPAMDGPSMSPCDPVTRCRRRMDFIEFGAPNPSRCQEVPCRFALRGPCEFGHHPAFIGKFSEFVRWVHLVILPESDKFSYPTCALIAGGALDVGYLTRPGFPTAFGRWLDRESYPQKLASIFVLMVMVATAIPFILLLPDSFINVHYPENERPVLAEIVKTFRTIPKTFSNTAGTVAFVIAALSLLLMFLWRFLLVAIKFARAGLAWVVRLLLQGPGVRIMGLVVRNAAFGGQCRQVLGPQELPDGELARSEAISTELNQKMSALSINTAAQAGEAFYFALAEGDALQIKEHILSRLTDPKLAHCQYYCENEIIDRIAELIAVPTSGHPGQSAY